MKNLILAFFISIAALPAMAQKTVDLRVYSQAGFIFRANILSIPQMQLLNESPMIKVNETYRVVLDLDDSVQKIEIKSDVIAGYPCSVTLDLNKQYTEATVVVSGTNLAPQCKFL